MSKIVEDRQKSQFCYLEKGVLELRQAATKKIERFVFFYWTTTDKLGFTDLSEVQKRFGTGEIVISRQRMMITPPPQDN